MRALSLRALTLTLLAGACAVATGCGAAPGDGSADQSDALKSGGPGGGCANAPPPALKECHTLVCVGANWGVRALPEGDGCTTSAGAPGTCGGGAQVGQCLTNLSGTLFPHYYVLAVQYAPPGAASTVDYGMGTTFGATTSVSSTWKDDFKVTVTNKEELLDFASGGLTVNAGFSYEDTTSSSVDVKATTQSDFTIDGDADRVDHGLDRIYLWLNPEIDVSGYGNNVSWTLTQRPDQMPNILYVTPTWLLNGTTPPDVLAALAAANITPADYPQILGVDPFAQGGTTIDPNRFVYETTQPYEPVTVAGQKPTQSKFSVSATNTMTTGDEAKVSYSAGFEAKGGFGFFGLLKTELKVSDQFTFTSDNKSSKSIASTLSASATITQPAFGYNGPVYLDIYLDTIYNTFLFALRSSTPVSQ